MSTDAKSLVGIRVALIYLAYVSCPIFCTLVRHIASRVCTEIWQPEMREAEHGINGIRNFAGRKL